MPRLGRANAFRTGRSTAGAGAIACAWLEHERRDRAGTRRAMARLRSR